MSLFGKAREALNTLFGDEEAAQQWLDENPEARNRAIEAAGMITRQEEGEGEGEGPTSDPEPTGDESDDLVVDDEVLDQLTQRIKEADFVMALLERVEKAETALEEAVNREKGIGKTIAELGDRLKALEVDEDQKRQQWQEDLPARNKQQRVVYRPRVVRADPDAPVDEMAEWQKQKEANPNIPH